MKTEIIKLTKDNILKMIEAKKVYLRDSNGQTFPIGDADYKALSFAGGVNRPASLDDVDFLLRCPDNTVYVTPEEVPI